jgi:hypothetical protein
MSEASSCTNGNCINEKATIILRRPSCGLPDRATLRIVTLVTCIDEAGTVSRQSAVVAGADRDTLPEKL